MRENMLNLKNLNNFLFKTEFGIWSYPRSKRQGSIATDDKSNLHGSPSGQSYVSYISNQRYRCTNAAFGFLSKWNVVV